MVKAKGIRGGATLEVTAEKIDNEIVIDPECYQDEYYRLAKIQRPVGGTYYPDENTLISAYNVLENHFFDKLIDITADDVEQIPYEADRIY